MFKKHQVAERFGKIFYLEETLSHVFKFIYREIPVMAAKLRKIYEYRAQSERVYQNKKKKNGRKKAGRKSQEAEPGVPESPNPE